MNEPMSFGFHPHQIGSPVVELIFVLVVYLDALGSPGDHAMHEDRLIIGACAAGISSG